MTKKVALGDVVIINPRPPKGLLDSDTVSFLPMASISEDGVILNQEDRKALEVKKGYTYFERNDVLLAKITPCFENGKAAYLKDLKHPVGFGSTEFHVLRANANRISPEYLFYLVWNPAVRRLGSRNMTGSAGQKRVPTDFLKEFKVRLPKIEEQKKIVSILGALTSIIKKRQRLSRLVEQLMRSIFLDMFGNPIINTSHWNTIKLGDISTIVRGSSPRPQGDPRFYRGPVPRLMVGDLTRDGRYVVPKIDSLTEEGSKKSRWIEAGTVVMAVSGNVGLPAILATNACIHDGFIAFTGLDTKKVKSEFLFDTLLFMKSTHSSREAGAIFKNLTTAQIKDMEIPVPPLELQEQYAEKIAQVNRTSRVQAEALAASNALFESLAQNYFGHSHESA